MGFLWIFYIGGGIFFGVVALVLFAIFGPQFLNWLGYKRDIRNAKRVNENARRLRLEKTTWKGLPLPTGKSGEFIVTDSMLLSLASRDEHLYASVLQDRARDMGVALEIWEEQFTFKHEFHVRWH